MNPKNIFSILIFVIAGVFYYNFVSAFKVDHVDEVVNQYDSLQIAFVRAQDQLSLTKLKEKRDALTLQETNVLENFVPAKLKSGTFVYNLAQFANQNRLTLKTIQYSVVKEEKEKEKRLIIDFTVDGRYEDFTRWLSTIENANTLIEVESIRGTKTGNVNDIITFNVKMIVSALSVD